jgi:hypothetical protein
LSDNAGIILVQQGDNSLPCNSNHIKVSTKWYRYRIELTSYIAYITERTDKELYNLDTHLFYKIESCEFWLNTGSVTLS